MKRLSGIMASHGAKSVLHKVVAGGGAGRYDLHNWYSSLEVGANSFQAHGADAEYQAMITSESLVEMRFSRAIVEDE